MVGLKRIFVDDGFECLVIDVKILLFGEGKYGWLFLIFGWLFDY